VEFRSRPTLRKRSRFMTSSKAWLAVSPPQSKPRSCLDPPQFPAGTVEKFLAVVQPRRAHSQERVLVQVLSACRTVFLCPKLQKRSVGPVLLRVPLTAVESSAAKPLSRGWRRFSAMEDRQVPPPLPLPSPPGKDLRDERRREGGVVALDEVVHGDRDGATQGMRADHHPWLRKRRCGGAEEQRRQRPV